MKSELKNSENEDLADSDWDEAYWLRWAYFPLVFTCNQNQVRALVYLSVSPPNNITSWCVHFCVLICNISKGKINCLVVTSKQLFKISKKGTTCISVFLSQPPPSDTSGVLLVYFGFILGFQAFISYFKTCGQLFIKSELKIMRMWMLRIQIGMRQTCWDEHYFPSYHIH